MDGMRAPKDRPTAVIACRAILILLIAGCAWAAIRPLSGEIWPNWLIGEFSGSNPEWPFVILTALGAVSLRYLWIGSPRGPAWALAFALISMGSLLHGLHVDRTLDFFLAGEGDLPTAADKVVMVLGLDQLRTWLLPVAMVIAGIMIRLLLVDSRVRDWADASRMVADGHLPSVSSGVRAERRKAWTGIIVIGLVLWLGWNGMGLLVAPFYELLGLVPIIGGWLTNFLDWLAALVTPFLVIACLVIWRVTERLVVDDKRIRLYVFRPAYTFFNAPWERISTVQAVDHGQLPPSLVVCYRTRFGLPYSIGVQGGRYAGGRDVGDGIIKAAANRSLR